MGGFFTFGTQFEARIAPGEIQGFYASDDEETWSMSYGRIERMIDAAEFLGVPRDAWPNFIDQDGRADLVTPQDIEERNSAFASAMQSLSEEQVSCNEELSFVWHQIRAGKTLLIDH